MTLPAHRAAEAGYCPLDSMLGGTLGEIEYASTAIVCTGHRAADVADRLNGSGLVIPAVEKRRILSVSYASRKFAGRAEERLCSAHSWGVPCSRRSWNTATMN